MNTLLKGACFLLLVAQLSAQSEEKLPVINIQKDNWKVLFQSFVNQSGVLNQKASNTLAKIPSLLIKSLSNSDDHVLDENEKSALRERAIQKELYKQYKQYNKLVDQRDRESLDKRLNRSASLAQISKGNTFETKISQQSRLIRGIKNIDRKLISVPDTLPLAIEDQSGLAYEPANIILLDQDYDLFIWGVVSGRNNVFQLEMRAYLASSKREIILWKGIIGNSNYEEVVEIIRNRSFSLLLGRPWASMKIEAKTSNDEDTLIYLDGKLQGQNSLTLYGLYPNQLYELEIIASGFQGRNVFVELEPNKLNTFEFNLDIKVPDEYVHVDATSIADVYLGVRYLGQTPLDVRVPGYETLLILSAPNMATINYDFGPENKRDLLFTMMPSTVLSLREEQEKRKRRFYWSSALFILSLAPPLVATGAGFVNQGLFANNQGNSQAARYQQDMNISFGVAIGTGVVALAMLILNIYDFAQYAKATRAVANTEYQQPTKVSSAEAEVQP